MKQFFSIIYIIILNLILCTTSHSLSIDAGITFNKPVRNLKQIKRQNIVSQTHDFSCGPASLATLLSFYFRDKVTEAQVIKHLLLTTDIYKVKAKKGFSLLDLKNFAKHRGYKVTGYKMDLEFLVELNQPVLIPMNIKDYSHFVIFRGLQGDRVFVADPALGNMTMKIGRFLEIWRDGIGLVVTKPNKKVKAGPLVLTDKEKAAFADPNITRKLFNPDIIGEIYAEGEFK